MDVYIILQYSSVFKIHSIFNIEEIVLQIAYRSVVLRIILFFIVHAWSCIKQFLLWHCHCSVKKADRKTISTCPQAMYRKVACKHSKTNQSHKGKNDGK